MCVWSSGRCSWIDGFRTEVDFGGGAETIVTRLVTSRCTAVSVNREERGSLVRVPFCITMNSGREEFSMRTIVYGGSNTFIKTRTMHFIEEIFFDLSIEFGMILLFLKHFRAYFFDKFCDERGWDVVLVTSPAKFPFPKPSFLSIFDENSSIIFLDFGFFHRQNLKILRSYFCSYLYYCPLQQTPAPSLVPRHRKHRTPPRNTGRSHTSKKFRPPEDMPFGGGGPLLLVPPRTPRNFLERPDDVVTTRCLHPDFGASRRRGYNAMSSPDDVVTREERIPPDFYPAFLTPQGHAAPAGLFLRGLFIIMCSVNFYVQRGRSC